MRRRGWWWGICVRPRSVRCLIQARWLQAELRQATVGLQSRGTCGYRIVALQKRVREAFEGLNRAQKPYLSGQAEYLRKSADEVTRMEGNCRRVRDCVPVGIPFGSRRAPGPERQRVGQTPGERASLLRGHDGAPSTGLHGNAPEQQCQRSACWYGRVAKTEDRLRISDRASLWPISEENGRSERI